MRVNGERTTRTARGPIMWRQRMRILATKALVGFAELIAALGLTVFVPAGTLDYWQGWVYLVVFVGCAALITVYLWRNDPQLLSRRVDAGPLAEPTVRQKIIQLCAALAFIGLLVVSALDHRFGWSHAPFAIIVLGDILVSIGFWVVFAVFRENTFTAATIGVAADQRVITTGPYARVRHPMYAGALILLTGTPLALDSWWGLLMVGVMTAVIVWRLLDEERFLMVHLPGYGDYRQSVRYRLVPGAW